MRSIEAKSDRASLNLEMALTIGLLVLVAVASLSAVGVGIAKQYQKGADVTIAGNMDTLPDADFDKDGTPNSADTDKDGDGVLDASDAEPFNAEVPGVVLTLSNSFDFNLPQVEPDYTLFNFIDWGTYWDVPAANFIMDDPTGGGKGKVIAFSNKSLNDAMGQANSSAGALFFIRSNADTEIEAGKSYRLSYDSSQSGDGACTSALDVRISEQPVDACWGNGPIAQFDSLAEGQMDNGAWMHHSYDFTASKGAVKPWVMFTFAMSPGDTMETMTYIANLKIEEIP